MIGQIIGKNMSHGYAGNYARQADMIIDSHPLGGTESVHFGTPVVYTPNGEIAAFGKDSTERDFVGVASREFKSSTEYLSQHSGKYEVGEAVSVFKRGCINVLCSVGTPKLGGKVYIRTMKNENIPTASVGGFEATEDVGKTVEISNCEWHGEKDANGVAEIRILNCNRA